MEQIYTESGQSTIAVSPTFVVFRKSYGNAAKEEAAREVCYGSIFSGFEGNQNPGGAYPNRAGFNINSNDFPYITTSGSTEAGIDTDDYGTENGSDFGPCSTIGNLIPAFRTITATRSGNTLTFPTGVTPVRGDRVIVNGSLRGNVTNVTSSPRRVTITITLGPDFGFLTSQTFSY